MDNTRRHLDATSEVDILVGSKRLYRHLVEVLQRIGGNLLHLCLRAGTGTGDSTPRSSELDEFFMNFE